MKKIISLILALVMVMGLAVSASAATVTKSQVDGDVGTKVDKFTGPASITVTLPTATNAESVNNTYKIYKVFDATTDANGTNISYTLVEGKTGAPSGFVVDAAGNVHFGTLNDDGTVTKNDVAELPTASINGIKTYVTDNDLVATVTTTKDDTSFTVANLPYGYYYITTTSGSLVTVNSTKPNAQVSDKNEYPTLTKKIVDGTSEVTTITADRGETITFKITVNIPATVNGDITVHDTLDEDMTYANLTQTTGISKVDSCNVEGCTANVHFNVDYDAVTKDENGNVSFTYTATLNADAETATAHTNVAKLTYSQFTSTETDEVSVYTYEVDVFKYTGEDKTGLPGAGFKLKNADGKYYTNTNGAVTWTDKGTEYTTSEDNEYTVNFAGIANGTYTLEESTVPAGYNKANDTEVKVENADRTGAIKDQGTQIEVLNQTGSELPSTGGIGTTLFYVIGGLLMTGAVVLLVTKKRMA